MEKTLSIEGMKCEGCAKIIKEKFEAITGITDVTIHLEKKEAIIASQAEIEIDYLKEALSDTKFTINSQ